MTDHEQSPLSRNEICLIRELIMTIIAEHDHRYADRFKAAETAVTAALASQERATSAAFFASEKAIVKAEAAQTAYNVRSNEFRQALDDQAKLQLSRTEANQRFTMLEQNNEEIKIRLGDLEKFRAGHSTKDTTLEQEHNKVWIYFGLVLSLLFGMVGVLLALATFFRK